MKFPVHFSRMVAAIGTAAALGSVLMFGAPAAQASPDETTRTAETGAASDSTVPVERIFLIQPDGSTVEAPPGTDVRAGSQPYYRWRIPSIGINDCGLYEMCLWDGSSFSGRGLFMGGSFPPCHGFRFENTYMQDHTASIWNRVQGGPVSIWDRSSDGTYNYHKYGLLPPDYSYGIPLKVFSYIMDAWVFDPANNCTRLVLSQVHTP